MAIDIVQYTKEFDEITEKYIQKMVDARAETLFAFKNHHDKYCEAPDKFKKLCLQEFMTTITIHIQQEMSKQGIPKGLLDV